MPSLLNLKSELKTDPTKKSNFSSTNSEIIDDYGFDLGSSQQKRSLKKTNDSLPERRKPFNSELRRSYFQFIEFYKTALETTLAQEVKHTSFDVVFPIPPYLEKKWPNASERLKEIVAEIAKQSKLYVHGTNKGYQQSKSFFKVLLKTFEKQSSPEEDSIQQEPLPENDGETRGDVPKPPSHIEKRIRATTNRHYSSVSDTFILELIEIFDDWHAELRKTEVKRQEAALEEVERRLQLKREANNKRVKQPGADQSPPRQSLRRLSPEEKLERIRTQNRARQAKRYARIKGKIPTLT